MTNPNKTSITVILDKSGSMQSCRTDTIGGYNTFIEGQKALPGECEITLVQFNEISEFTYKSQNIKDLQPLEADQYRPLGNTALLDAVGKAINGKGAEFAAMNEEDRPSKVIFVIITDGQENCSEAFTQATIKEMVEHQKSVYSWDFTFLGANIDTFAVADSIGIVAGKSLSFSSTSRGGSVRAFASINSYAVSARAGGASLANVNYTKTDRDSNK
jgi:hypothetical protein